MSANDLIGLVVNGCFVLIALATLIDFFRFRDRARLDIALMFGALAFSILGGAIIRALGITAPWFATLSSLVVLAQPYLLLRLVAHFRPLSARVRWAALAGLGLSWVILLLNGSSSSNPLLLLIIAYFVLVEGYATWAFVTGARRAGGTKRWRLIFAAAGSGWFALLILAAGVTVVAPQAAAIISPAIQVMALLSALSYYIAFAPPPALRRAWQLAELYRFLHTLAGRPIAERVRGTLDHLCPAVTRAVGALGSAVYLPASTAGAFSLGATDLPLLAGTALGAGAGSVERAWRERRTIAVQSAAEFGPQLELLAADLGATSLLAVPIMSPAQVRGVLVAFFARPSLFPADDQEVLALLADQAALALESGELFDQQRELVEQLAAANKDLEGFAYSVSHDLRAPLRAMDGFSRILMEDSSQSLSVEAQHYLTRIRENAKRMGRLIDDLLAFSRLGRQTLKLQRTEPAVIVAQAWEELRAEQDGRDVTLQVDALPPCLADPGLLRQVYANLLGNALKYSRKRAQAHITAGCLSTEPDATYFVRDNGVGFDPAYTDKLFGVFQRLHRADEYEGTGVGLAIVARIVQRHGGHVSAESTPDQGATFYFSLKGLAPDVRTDD